MDTLASGSALLAGISAPGIHYGSAAFLWAPSSWSLEYK